MTGVQNLSEKEIVKIVVYRVYDHSQYNIDITMNHEWLVNSNKLFLSVGYMDLINIIYLTGPLQFFCYYPIVYKVLSVLETNNYRIYYALSYNSVASSSVFRFNVSFEIALLRFVMSIDIFFLVRGKALLV